MQDVSKYARLENGVFSLNVAAMLADTAAPDMDQLRSIVKDILAESTTPPVAEDPEGIIVSSGAELHKAIPDAGTTPIYCKSGTYIGGFKLQTGTTIRAYPGHSPLFMGAEVIRSDAFVKNGNAYSLEWTLPFYQHPAAQTRTINHRRSMQPHLIVCDGQPLRTVYNQAELYSFVPDSPGNMYLEGTAEKPVRIWIAFADGKAPVDYTIRAATHQTIFEGAHKNVDGVELAGLMLRFCANTGHQGSIDFPENADNWRLRDIDTQFSNSEGIHITGQGHDLARIYCFNHGHVGIAPLRMLSSHLEDISYGGNAWKNGVDPKWHAGGLKAVYSSHNTYLRLKSMRDHGAGFWEDLYCQDNTLDTFEIIESLAFGLFTEHHSMNNQYRNGLVRGVRKFEGIGSGLQIQGHVRGCKYQSIHFADNADGMVFYKRQEDRGESGSNTFIDLSGDNNGSNNRWLEEGVAPNLPDVFKDMEMPIITRR